MQNLKEEEEEVAVVVVEQTQFVYSNLKRWHHVTYVYEKLSSSQMEKISCFIS